MTHRVHGRPSAAAEKILRARDAKDAAPPKPIVKRRPPDALAKAVRALEALTPAERLRLLTAQLSRLQSHMAANDNLVASGEEAA